MCFIFDGWVCVGYFFNWELWFVNVELWFSYLVMFITDPIDQNTCVVGGISILWHFSILSLPLHSGKVLILVRPSSSNLEFSKFCHDSISTISSRPNSSYLPSALFVKFKNHHLVFNIFFNKLPKSAEHHFLIFYINK